MQIMSAKEIHIYKGQPISTWFYFFHTLLVMSAHNYVHSHREISIILMFIQTKSLNIYLLDFGYKLWSHLVF